MKLSEPKRSMNMMWACVALAVVAVTVALVGKTYVLLFAVMCVGMLGVMFWMMMGSSGAGNRGGERK
jgi:hypothetical protein